ncbi:MAG: MFS transporter [Anaerolineaceae bacterium]|nr:MFS transporter [Anaerolineaceae bacterium]
MEPKHNQTIIEAQEEDLSAELPSVAPVSREPSRPEAQHRPHRRWFHPARTFTALKYPNYRLWFYGQLASLVGTWMQSTAQGYLVFQLTHSPAYLGYVGFAAGIPSVLLMLFGGVLSDRMSRRKLMVITQSSMLVLAFTLAALTFTGLIRPWEIVLMAFLLGVANAFDAPARQAFVLEMVSREDMGNAIALNSAMFNMATAAGPAIAGLAYAAVGPAWCFTINGISFLAVIVALVMMKLAPFVPQEHSSSAITELKAGLTYVIHHPDVRILIAMLGLVSIFGMGYVTLIPAWAVNILKGDATTNGLIQSARGVGSLLGALMIASLGRFSYRGKLLTVGTFVFPVLLLVFSFIRVLPLSLVVMVGVGWGFMVYANLTNNLVQHHVPDELRGRVMGIYSLTFFGMMPIGALLAGTLAQQLGAPMAIEITAGISLALAFLLFIAVPKIRDLE